MVELVPEERIGDQEVLYPRFDIVEYVGAPVGVVPQSGVAIFVEWTAVEKDQSLWIGGKVCGYPVQNYPNAPLMQVVD